MILFFRFNAGKIPTRAKVLHFTLFVKKPIIGRMSTTRILFVCQGNICRSPLAMFLLRFRLQERGLEEEFVVTSAGLEKSTQGEDMHEGSKRELDAHHVPYQKHEAHMLSPKEYLQQDYVIVMEGYQKIGIKRMMSGAHPEKLHRLLDFTPLKRDIADPYYTGDFATAYADISKGIDGFIEEVAKKAS